MDRFLKSLSDETRLKIIAILMNGEFSVQELTQILEMGQSRISRHLKILTDAHITQFRRVGSWIYYRLESDQDSYLKNIIENIKQWLKKSKLHQALSSNMQKILDRRRSQSQCFFAQVGDQWLDLQAKYLDLSMFYKVLTGEIGRAESLADLGCGVGQTISVLLPYVGKIIGVDNSPEMLDMARKNLQSLQSVDLRLGNLEHLPLRDEEVEIVLATFVLHHIAQPSSVFSEFFRVLSPGGRLIVIDFITHSNEILRDKMADLWMGFSEKEIFGWMTPASIQAGDFRELPGGRGSNRIFIASGIKVNKQV